MAIVSVIRFDENSGCICVEQESWFLRNRRSFFSDMLYSCVPEEEGEKLGVEVFFGGVGYPPYHYEVAKKATKEMKQYLSSKDLTSNSLRVEHMCKVVLKSFQDVHRRKIDDRINFLYGFNSDDFTGECYKKDGNIYQIKQEKVKKRVENIISMKEKSQDHTLIIPPNEGCVIGISPEDGFHAYCIKEQEGVLSYYSCGFDCLGVGKYSGAAAIAHTINQCTVKERREGYGKEEGLLTILNSILEGGEHYSQIGGNICLVVLDAKGSARKEQVKVISDFEGYICLEVVKAYREEILSKEDTIKIITGVVFDSMPWEKAEKLMFEKASDINELDRVLRNYKKPGSQDKITSGLEKMYRKKEPAKEEVAKI